MEAKALNIDAILGKVKNRVSRAGVELEGAWAELPPGILQLEGDSSVYPDRKPAGCPFTGELPIGPVEPAALPELMTRTYPTKVNHTCGMHVHMSFDNLWYYQLLMVPEYQETMITYLTKWANDNKFKEDHHIYTRLRGGSEYCLRGFWPDIQAATKRKTHDRTRPGHRYTIIHYCGRQQTIECRVLPMMTKAPLAISAVKQVIEITNACLYVLGAEDKREVVKGKILMKNGVSYEEFSEEVI